MQVRVLPPRPNLSCGGIVYVDKITGLHLVELSSILSASTRFNASLTQWLEYPPLKRKVLGSSPRGSTNLMIL